ncbi:MAG TPA: hypothetical protein PKY78_01550 [Candidatus Omnitrophota bacterium]|nr:hypothetical protein [Candidatus Omnitrophota bacterium]
MRKVLVVCTGNSCRSILAEAYMRKRFKEEKLDIELRSAGTSAVNGFPPADETITTLEEENINTEDLHSTRITEEMINNADIILVMETIHKARIIDMVPSAGCKVFFLAEYDKEAQELTIPDPIGRSLAFYKLSFGIIKRSVEGFIKWLKK